MIDSIIKKLREAKEMTQTELAKRMGITRSSVNAWEMGISVPSTQYIVELSHIFGVSTDYLLGQKKGAFIDVDGLSESDVEVVVHLVEHLKKKSKNSYM